MTQGESLNEEGNKEKKRAGPEEAVMEDASETNFLMPQFKISLLWTN